MLAKAIKRVQFGTSWLLSILREEDWNRRLSESRVISSTGMTKRKKKKSTQICATRRGVNNSAMRIKQTPEVTMVRAEMRRRARSPGRLLFVRVNTDILTAHKLHAYRNYNPTLFLFVSFFCNFILSYHI